MNKIDYSDTAKDILYTLVAVGVIPGLIFWLVGQFWFIDRAILNIDYLLVCLALAPFGAVTVVAGMDTHNRYYFLLRTSLSLQPRECSAFNQ